MQRKKLSAEYPALALAVGDVVRERVLPGRGDVRVAPEVAVAVELRHPDQAVAPVGRDLRELGEKVGHLAIAAPWQAKDRVAAGVLQQAGVAGQAVEIDVGRDVAQRQPAVDDVEIRLRAGTPADAAKARAQAAERHVGMLVAVAAETRVEIADMLEHGAGEAKALAAHHVGDAGIGGAAGAGQHVLAEMGRHVVDVAERQRRGDPFLLPAIGLRQHVVVQEDQHVGGGEVHQVVEAAVLVPGDAHVAAEHGGNAGVGEHGDGAVGGAVVADHERVVDGGEALEPGDEVEQGVAAVIGGERDPELRPCPLHGVACSNTCLPSAWPVDHLAGNNGF